MAVASVMEAGDEDLVRQIAKGERRALETLYARHHRRVFHFIRRFEDNTAMAEDLANDVFLDVWSLAGRFEFRSRVTSWLLGIARYKALNARRARKKTVDPEEALGGLADGADTPEITAQKVSKAEALRNCIAALPEEHRIVIDLVYYHETSVRDVAEILQVPENTVKTRMFNARRKLSALMQAAGLDRGWP
ncbi:MAG: RNA polymerase subunit sigma [Phyllobacteriaceae bacterium]|nr:RNA polymerase subunit sigma [Phyllobacteriaceae bacterium]MBA90814.1 RNA polymerase subunit sigma [Phyllobacteriaceae bacterium]